MHPSEVKNIISEAINEYRESIRTLGCPTEIGCFKGKEITNYLEGKLKSDLNDIGEFIHKQAEVNTGMLKKFDEASKFVREAASSSASAANIIQNSKEMIDVILNETKTTVKESKKAVEDGKKENRTLLTGIIVSLILMVGSSMYGNFAKLHQDGANQKETVQYLKILSKNQLVLEQNIIEMDKKLEKEKEKIK